MFALRRVFNGLRVSGGAAASLPRRGLEEFYPLHSHKVTSKVVADAESKTQKAKESGIPASVGAQPVVVGGEWKAWMLRQKSTDDLHKLWYVLLKERNALLTELAQCRQKNIMMPNPTRRQKVKKSMARIKLVLHERSQVFKANQAKKAAQQQQQQQQQQE